MHNGFDSRFHFKMEPDCLNLGEKNVGIDEVEQPIEIQSSTKRPKAYVNNL